jgi:bifunctional ADP-heptose synthase (sugar kinase/adenylyltransferase)
VKSGPILRKEQNAKSGVRARAPRRRVTDLRAAAPGMDRRVKESKGDERPIHTAEQRKYNLLQLLGISDVWVFDTDEELDELIKNYQPDLFVIGDDYKYKPIIGYTYAKKVKFFDRIPELSTTKIINK